MQKILKDAKPLEVSSPAFAQDTFDFGLVILQCAVGGDLSIYDPPNTLTWSNIKTVVTGPTFQKNESYACCLIHSEIMVRKAIMKNLEGTDQKLKHNKNGKRETKEEPEKNEPYLSLREILKMKNRFSDAFESFLCSCLKLNANKRTDLKSLATHKFMTADNIHKGPLLSINELLQVEKAESLNHNQQENSHNMYRKHLEKLDEALRVAFLNKAVKEKFDLALFKGQESLNHKRLRDLAEEIGAPEHQLEKMIKDCFTNDYKISLL